MYTQEIFILTKQSWFSIQMPINVINHIIGLVKILMIVLTYAK